MKPVATKKGFTVEIDKPDEDSFSEQIPIPQTTFTTPIFDGQEMILLNRRERRRQQKRERSEKHFSEELKDFVPGTRRVGKRFAQRNWEARRALEAERDNKRRAAANDDAR